MITLDNFENFVPYKILMRQKKICCLGMAKFVPL